MSELVIITNNVPRDIIYGYELTAKEREWFDYYEWDKIELGEESDPEFFRYKGQLYSLDDFTAEQGMMKDSGMPDSLSGWEAYASDSFFSGVVIRFAKDDMGEPDYERVIVGWYYVKG